MSCGLFFGLWAQRDFAKPFPRHISLCVVRRDWDGDAVISRPSFLLSLALSLRLSEFISLSLVLRKRVTEGAKCHGTGSGRGEREIGRGRKETEVVYLAVFATLLPWLRSSSLPKAAASQATLPNPGAHWTGRPPPFPPPSSSSLLANYWQSSLSSTSHLLLSAYYTLLSGRC